MTVTEWNHRKIDVLEPVTGELVCIEIFKTSSGWWARKSLRGDEAGLGNAPIELERIPQIEEMLAERDTFGKYKTKLQRLLYTGMVHVEGVAPATKE